MSRDRIVDYISSYASALRFEALPSEVVHQVKRLLLDSLGCAIGGYTSEPSKIAREMAYGVESNQPASIFFSGQKTTPELAAFANGTMIRYLDFNDGYTGKVTCHPSEMFAPVLSCAEAYNVDGKLAITATVLAYEILCRFCDKADIYPRRFDSSTLGGISSTVGTAKVLGLSKEQMAQSINLAAACNIGIRQIRIGELSMWKGCAFANASRNGIFATRLAAKGMTGPENIFEGRSGYFHVVTGAPFELDQFGGNGQPFKIMEAKIKRFPSGIYSQTAIEAVLKIRSKLNKIEDIAEITIHVWDDAYRIMAGDSQKWRPRTRESADHSLPYVVSVALIYGELEIQHFSDEFLMNYDVLALAKKIKVIVSEECNQAAPEAAISIVDVITKDGDIFSEKIAYHRGHFKNPMSDEEVEDKFISMANGMLRPDLIKLIVDNVWNLDKINDLSLLMNLLRI